ncbi:hypothetical protein CROQUDRAFT_136845 [Cronartium quercuum f. sp. fusiforme G11]|uniref:FAD/NAD(P)-binding domain-containing protein n=1 Tax=Cronartium quercuum f. sp. fusiforme G11 TaxID=708437 RepID=A0A9P6N9K1_9BASI|nr:hypothetical protein CROQUDRAFT_136845 [Cronartium quercuum f. sp. fusiforme G11]
MSTFSLIPYRPCSALRALRSFSHDPVDIYDAAIVGAGPAGLTAISNLLDKGSSKVSWIDPLFQAGRVGEMYREVPSNTRTKLFLNYVTVSPTLSNLVKHASTPNAYTVMESLDPEKGCQLSYAADLIVFLTQELMKQRQDSIHPFKGLVRMMESENNQPWRLDVDPKASNDSPISLRAHKVVLATGSAPVHPPSSPIPILDLDIALSPSRLRHYLAQLEPDTTLAVIGSSHSAILAIKNITDISTRHWILHFYRSSLKFAEQKDGWILYDNTGLKGLAADWAREVYPTLTQIKRVRLSGKPEEEKRVYEQELKSCTRVIYAIGYSHNPYPRVMVDGLQSSLDWNPINGNFGIPHLYGCGIAFPEKVKDPEGNVESAVGFWKFMRFVKRVSEDWK